MVAAIDYGSEQIMHEARLQYFRANGFGDDGGYHKKIEWVKLGPVKLPIFNVPARVYALRFHDMHHVLTGYATDWGGEFEISAWECAAGCYDAWVAWALNLGGFAAGLVVMPRRTLRAFLRGRYSRSLYRHAARNLEGETVGELRTFTGLDRSPGIWRARDLGWLAVVTPVALVWGAVQVGVMLAVLLAPLVVIGWAIWWAIAG